MRLSSIYEFISGLVFQGMLKPKQPISFGLLTRGRLSLTFPGWNVSNCNQQNNADINEVKFYIPIIFLCVFNVSCNVYP